MPQPRVFNPGYGGTPYQPMPLFAPEFTPQPMPSIAPPNFAPAPQIQEQEAVTPMPDPSDILRRTRSVDPMPDSQKGGGGAPVPEPMPEPEPQFTKLNQFDLRQLSPDHGKGGGGYPAALPPQQSSPFGSSLGGRMGGLF